MITEQMFAFKEAKAKQSVRMHQLIGGVGVDSAGETAYAVDNGGEKWG
jgi:hypothetical protein